MGVDRCVAFLLQLTVAPGTQGQFNELDAKAGQSITQAGGPPAGLMSHLTVGGSGVLDADRRPRESRHARRGSGVLAALAPAGVSVSHPKERRRRARPWVVPTGGGKTRWVNALVAAWADALGHCGANRRSLTGLAVDGLAEQVGMTVVSCVLLDHVQQDPPEAEAPAAA